MAMLLRERAVRWLLPSHARRLRGSDGEAVAAEAAVYPVHPGCSVLAYPLCGDCPTAMPPCVSFKYTEPISRHNNAKHWVDDVNNRRHAPIGLEDVWATKWWPDRQFTFICSVAEVNAVMSQARGRNAIAEQTLKFRRRLAQQMLENKIIDTGQSPCSPATLRKRKRLDGALLHTLETRKTFTGSWDSRNGTWTKVKSKYLKTKCKTCPFECRTYCSCQREVTMCTKCWADHKSVCSNTS